MCEVFGKIFFFLLLNLIIKVKRKKQINERTEEKNCFVLYKKDKKVTYN